MANLGDFIKGLLRLFTRQNPTIYLLKIALVALVAFATFSCSSQAGEDEEVISKTGILKAESDKKAEQLLWTRELEGVRLSKRYDNAPSVKKGVPLTPEVMSVVGVLSEPVYPTLPGFGSLNDSAISGELRGFLLECVDALSEWDLGALKINKDKLFSLVLFKNDVEKKFSEPHFDNYLLGEPFFGAATIQVPIRLFVGEKAAGKSIDVILEVCRADGNTISQSDFRKSFEAATKDKDTNSLPVNTLNGATDITNGGASGNPSENINPASGEEKSSSKAASDKSNNDEGKNKDSSDNKSNGALNNISDNANTGENNTPSSLESGNAGDNLNGNFDERENNSTNTNITAGNSKVNGSESTSLNKEKSENSANTLENDNTNNNLIEGASENKAQGTEGATATAFDDKADKTKKPSHKKASKKAPDSGEDVNGAGSDKTDAESGNDEDDLGDKKAAERASGNENNEGLDSGDNKEGASGSKNTNTNSANTLDSGKANNKDDGAQSVSKDGGGATFGNSENNGGVNSESDEGANGESTEGEKSGEGEAEKESAPKKRQRNFGETFVIDDIDLG